MLTRLLPENLEMKIIFKKEYVKDEINENLVDFNSVNKKIEVSNYPVETRTRPELFI